MPRGHDNSRPDGEFFRSVFEGTCCQRRFGGTLPPAAMAQKYISYTGPVKKGAMTSSLSRLRPFYPQSCPSSTLPALQGDPKPTSKLGPELGISPSKIHPEEEEVLLQLSSHPVKAT